MVSTFSTQRSRGGFTLMEVMLATAVAAVILIAIQTVYFSALRLSTTTQARIASGVELQRAVTLLRNDLSGVMGTTSGTFFVGIQTSATSTISDDGGERVSPDFYTTTGAIDDRSTLGDVQCIAYSLQGGSGNGTARTLCRLVDHNLLPVSTDKPVVEPLLKGVKSMSLEYYDGSSWQTDWDSSSSTGTGTMPLAIRVTLELQRDEQNPGKTETLTITAPVAVGVSSSDSSDSSSSSSSTSS